MPGSLPVDGLQTFEEAWRDPYRGGSWCEGPWGLIRSLFRVSMNDSRVVKLVKIEDRHRSARATYPLW